MKKAKNLMGLIYTNWVSPPPALHGRLSANWGYGTIPAKMSSGTAMSWKSLTVVAGLMALGLHAADRPHLILLLEDNMG